VIGCEFCDAPCALHTVRYDPTGDGGGERLPECCSCRGCNEPDDCLTSRADVRIIAACDGTSQSDH
jgi:hypothetical protein